MQYGQAFIGSLKLFFIQNMFFFIIYNTVAFFFFGNEPIKILHLTNVLNVNKTKQHNNSPNINFPRSKYVIQQNSTNPIVRSKLLFMEQNSCFLYNTNH